MPLPVLKVMQEYLALESVTGGYETADQKSDAIAGFYQNMGRLLNADARNIAFTSSATNSYARALSSIPFENGDSILIANEDYISNQIAFLSLQKRLGIKLLRAESAPDGGVDVEDMRKLMDHHKPRLVSLSHIPTNSGLIQPAEEVGKLCRERGILFMLDACQSAGQIPLDVTRLQCDFLTGTFRKFMRGPRGSGFLFISEAVLNSGLYPLFIDMRGADWVEKDHFKLRSDARRFEDWELPYELVLGSSASAEYALGIGLDKIKERNEFLCSLVRKRVQAIGLSILDKGKNLGSIITIKVPGKESAAVLQTLRDRNINTSIAGRGSAVIDFDAKGVTWALRISPHYYNTEEEIEILVKALTEF